MAGELRMKSEIVLMIVFSLILQIYDYGGAENSRFFAPNVIKIYGGYDLDVLDHEIAHYFDFRDRGVQAHDDRFWFIFNSINTT